jgi:hypothetical protein
MSKRKARILTGVAVVVVALGALYGMAVAVSTVRLRRAYAALRTDGRPMDRKEIIPPTVADTNNAALLYESAVSLLQATPAEHNRQSPPDARRREQMEREKCSDLLSYLPSLSSYFGRDTPTPEIQQELKQLMSHSAVDHALFAIEQGTQRLVYRQKCDYNAGLHMALPNLHGIKALGYIVGTKARMEAEAGEMDRAWHWIVVQAKMADALRTQPTIVSQLVRLNMISLSCETIQRVSEVAPPTKEQRLQIETILSTFDDAAPLARAVDGERLLYGEWLFTLPKHDLYKELCDFSFSEERMPWSLIPWVVMRWLAFKPFLLADHANYVQVMHENAKAMEGPFSPVTPAKEHGRFTLTTMLRPAMHRIRVFHFLAVAKVHMTRTGLALLQYRADHGTFPNTLDVLNTDAASDPFIQGPLHYRVDGNGFILYSVGEDRKDSSGTSKPPKGKAELDILWRFPAPAPAAISSNQ